MLNNSKIIYRIDFTNDVIQQITRFFNHSGFCEEQRKEVEKLKSRVRLLTRNYFSQLL